MPVSQFVNLFTTAELLSAGVPLADMVAAGVSLVSLRDNGVSIADLFQVTTVSALIASGVSLVDMIAANISISDLKTRGVTATQLFTSNVTLSKDITDNYTINELVQAGYDIVAIVTAGIGGSTAGLQDFIDAGVTDASILRSIGFTATELRGAGYTLNALITGQYSTAQLKAASYTAAELKAGGITLSELVSVGYTASNLKNASFTPIQLKPYFTIGQLKTGGFTASELSTIYSLSELVGAGFNAIQLKTAGYSAFSLSSSFTLSDLINAGFTATQLRDSGYYAGQLKSSFSLSDLIDAGFNVADLKTAEYSAIQLKPYFTIAQMKAAGFTALQLKNAQYLLSDLIGAGFIITELKAGGYTATELKPYFSLQQLKDALFGASDLKIAGFTAKQLVDDVQPSGYYPLEHLVTAGYTATELRDAGFVLAELTTFPFNATQLKNALFTAAELKGDFTLTQLVAAGFTATQLKNALFTAEQLVGVNTPVGTSGTPFTLEVLAQAQYNIASLKSAGFTTTELYPTYFSLPQLITVFTVSELKAHPFTAKQLADNSVGITQLVNANYSAEDLVTAGFSLSEIVGTGATFTLSELISSGVTMAELKSNSFSAKAIRDNDTSSRFALSDYTSAGFTAGGLKTAGYSASDLKLAGYTIQQLSGADGFGIADLNPLYLNDIASLSSVFDIDALKGVGYNATALADYFTTAVMVAAFTVAELKAVTPTPYTAFDLQPFITSATGLRENGNGFTASELRELNDLSGSDGTVGPIIFNLSQLVAAGYNLVELKTAQYTVVELKGYFNVSQLSVSFTLVQLAEGSMTASELRSVKNEDNSNKFSLLDLATVKNSSQVLYFSVGDLANANYSAEELKNLKDDEQANVFTLSDLWPIYSVTLLKPVYSLADLLYSSGSPGIPLSELIPHYTVSELKADNVSLSALVSENLPVSDLRTSFTASELLSLTGDNQVSVSELKTGGYSALDLYNASVSLATLFTEGYAEVDLASIFGNTSSLVTKLNTALVSTSESISTHSASSEVSPTLSESRHTVSITYANLTRYGISKQIRDDMKAAMKDEYSNQLGLPANAIYVEIDAALFKFYISYVNEGVDVSTIKHQKVMNIAASSSFISTVASTIIVSSLPADENLNSPVSEPAVSPTFDAEYVDFTTKITYPNVNLSSLDQTVRKTLKTNIKTQYVNEGYSADRVIVELKQGSLEIYVTILDESVTSSSVPVCFVKGTPITTNQGNIAIEKLIPGKHTIRGKSIAGITTTRPLQKHIICFEKNSLGKNIPSMQTLVSKEHKVLYKGTMTKARDLVNVCENVTKVPYNGEMLYNVLLDKHENMNVNNMICETLDPKSVLAKISRMEPSNEKFYAMQRLNKIVKNNSTYKYEKLTSLLK